MIALDKPAAGAIAYESEIHINPLEDLGIWKGGSSSGSRRAVYRPKSATAMPRIKTCQSAENDAPLATLYRTRPRSGQLLGIGVFSAVFGVSAALGVVSLFCPSVGSLTPWLFWLIPAVGSLGISAGIVLNILVDGR